MHRNSSWHSHIYTSSDQHILFSPNLLAPCFSNVITCRQWQNDTRAASTASAHVNPHYYLLRKVKIKKKKKRKVKIFLFAFWGKRKMYSWISKLNAFFCGWLNSPVQE